MNLKNRHPFLSPSSSCESGTQSVSLYMWSRHAHIQLRYLKSTTSEPNNHMIMELVMQQLGLNLYNVYITYFLRMASTSYSMSKLVAFALEWKLLL